MHDATELARMVSAASYLLLNPPDDQILVVLEAQAGKLLDHARQDFYDFLCIPQSGCFLPPYAHVLTQVQEIEDYCHFPKPKYDGGDALLTWYDAAGFDTTLLPADPILAAVNRPLDHVGVLLAFLALLLDATQDSEVDHRVLGEFLGEHIQPWSETFVNLLTQAESPYIVLLGETLRDLFDEVRSAYPPLLPARLPSASRLIPIQPVA